MQVIRGFAALVAVAVAAGCATGSAATEADEARALAEPVAQAASAVGTAQLSVQLLGDDRTSAPVTDTALVESIHVLADAADAVTTFIPSDATGSGWQTDSLDAVQSAQTAVARARAWANGTGTRADATTSLEDSADRLDEIAATLETAGGS
ncbi:hypothetical protein [Cellulomonas sp.]|uniref:hypothetical protein n=1 Tax=Cellulomonas sp. TaxID=40001 RepID=UPI003BA9D46D